MILRAFGETFVTLFVITDPIGNAPIFVAITRNLTPRERQRAAVLTYAFDARGARVARSGAIQGNPQSLGVSRKLGYEVVGTHVVSPRGEPLEHTDVELRRESFRSPVPVELVALAPLLPLFGAS